MERILGWAAIAAIIIAGLALYVLFASLLGRWLGHATRQAPPVPGLTAPPGSGGDGVAGLADPARERRVPGDQLPFQAAAEWEARWSDPDRWRS